MPRWNNPNCGFQKGHDKRVTHGMAKTRFYTIWCRLKPRCLNKQEPAYPNYGGRGITLPKKWLKFEGFYEDMYKSYQSHAKRFGEKNTSIDRINNNKSYLKQNCRWTTKKQQANNRRTNHLITYRGETLTISQWADKIGIQQKTLYQRIFYKWSIEETLTKPLKILKPRKII